MTKEKIEKLDNLYFNKMESQNAEERYDAKIEFYKEYKALNARDKYIYDAHKEEEIQKGKDIGSVLGGFIIMIAVIILFLALGVWF